MLPRSSLSKRKSEALNGDFQNMHLAVFPYQIEFQKDTNLQIQLYFEKSKCTIDFRVPNYRENINSRSSLQKRDQISNEFIRQPYLF
jgi:hypothetical protein